MYYTTMYHKKDL